MKPSTIPEMRGGNFILDGKPAFIYSGEFHYFRCDPKDWPDRLASGTISRSVPRRIGTVTALIINHCGDLVFAWLLMPITYTIFP